MMFETYFLPVMIFAAMGAAAGVLLTAASKVFSTDSDPRTEKIAEALPQVNCGACGYKGCADYAKAVAEKGEAVDLCRVGGEKTAAALSEIMGVSAEKTEKLAAAVRCSGDCESRKKSFDYEGEKTCAAAKSYYGGMYGCKWGCIGFGDCQKVCIADAIELRNGLARINRDKCVDCGLCVKACPNDLIELTKISPKAFVYCSSKESGKKVRAVCSKGCIGCRLCEKNCAFEAVRVTDNLARVDPEKCTACGKCSKKCPSKVIRI